MNLALSDSDPRRKSLRSTTGIVCFKSTTSAFANGDNLTPSLSGGLSLETAKLANFVMEQIFETDPERHVAHYVVLRNAFAQTHMTRCLTIRILDTCGKLVLGPLGLRIDFWL